MECPPGPYLAPYDRGVDCDCVAESTDCIEATGNGSAATPWTFDPVIPATVTHPWYPGPPGPVPNGLACGPAGLEVQPSWEWGITYYGAPTAPPAVVVNTGGGPYPLGGVAWGAPAVGRTVNFNPDRPAIANRYTEAPLVIATLEPGAGMTYGWVDGILNLTIGTFENTGTTTATWRLPAHQLNQVGGLAAPGVGSLGPVESIGLWIETHGFTGLSSVSTFGGVALTYESLPI